MLYGLQYFEDVYADVNEAKNWYKLQRDGLEIIFADEVADTVFRIRSMPTAYSRRYKKIRIAHTKKFPYNIHFYIDEPGSSIVVTAIIHNRRNPKVAKNRV